MIEVLSCWLLHGVAGAYRTLAAEFATPCVTGGERVAGLHLDWSLGWSISQLTSWVLQSRGRGRGCSPAMVKDAGAGGHGCSSCSGMRRSSAGEGYAGQ